MPPLSDQRHYLCQGAFPRQFGQVWSLSTLSGQMFLYLGDGVDDVSEEPANRGCWSVHQRCVIHSFHLKSISNFVLGLHMTLAELRAAAMAYEGNVHILRQLAAPLNAQAALIRRLQQRLRSQAKDPRVVFEYFKQNPQFLLNENSLDFLSFFLGWDTVPEVSSRTHFLEFDEKTRELRLLRFDTREVSATVSLPENPTVRFPHLFFLF